MDNMFGGDDNKGGLIIKNGMFLAALVLIAFALTFIIWQVTGIFGENRQPLPFSESMKIRQINDYDEDED